MIDDYDHLLPVIGGVLGNIADDDLPIALRLLASSGNFDGDGETSEAKNLIAFGRGLEHEPLSPIQGGIERSALFDKPRDLFLVVYLQPLPRRCALDSADCLVDGRSADRHLPRDRRVDGTPRWLNFGGTGIKPGQVLHVAIATSEGRGPEGVPGPAAGRSRAFRSRCST